jgi:hypothetical protein
MILDRKRLWCKLGTSQVTGKGSSLRIWVIGLESVFGFNIPLESVIRTTLPLMC